MKLTAIIVDDEPLARKLISNLLNKVSEIEIIGLYGTGKDAIKAIDSLEPDILYLDIQLKDMNGFAVLRKIQVEPPLTIFATAFDTYALQAFNIFAFDYLLKPFTEERFYKSVHRAIETLNSGETTELQKAMANLLYHVKPNMETHSKKRIPVPHGNKTVFVSAYDISYILASNYYVEIHTSKAKYLLRNSMSRMMVELNNSNFIRIHRSSIVNVNHIDELIYSDYGEIDVKMYDEKQLRVSKSYRKEFLVKIGVRK